MIGVLAVQHSAYSSLLLLKRGATAATVAIRLKELIEKVLLQLVLGEIRENFVEIKIRIPFGLLVSFDFSPP